MALYKAETDRLIEAQQKHVFEVNLFFFWLNNKILFCIERIVVLLPYFLHHEDPHNIIF